MCHSGSAYMVKLILIEACLPTHFYSSEVSTKHSWIFSASSENIGLNKLGGVF